jgi:hypothetical protein
MVEHSVVLSSSVFEALESETKSCTMHRFSSSSTCRISKSKTSHEILDNLLAFKGTSEENFWTNFQIWK